MRQCTCLQTQASSQVPDQLRQLHLGGLPAARVRQDRSRRLGHYLEREGQHCRIVRAPHRVKSADQPLQKLLLTLQERHAHPQPEEAQETFRA